MALRWRFLCFVRLLVAVTALFAAQPASAASVVDRIVFVVQDDAPADRPSEERASAPRARRAPASPPPAVTAAPVFATLQSFHALPERVYLLHCALLR